MDLHKTQPAPLQDDNHPAAFSPAAQQLAEEGTRYMVAVDGSKQSGRAFRWLVKQVALVRDPSKVEVIIINFLPNCEFAVENSTEYQTAKKELLHCLEEYKRILANFNACHPLLNTPLQPLMKSFSLQISSVVRLVEGGEDIRESLCTHVKEDRIDTLVMGNTGKSAIDRMLLGSLSEYCIRHAECAVVVVK